MTIKIQQVLLLSMATEHPNIIETDILIDKDKIIQIAPDITKKVDKIIDGRGMLAMPGFVNTHTHSGMSIFRGYQEDHSLMDWLKTVVFPKENLLTPEDMYWTSGLSCLEMLQTGTTTFSDMYFHIDSIIQAVEDTGLRAIEACSISDNTPDIQCEARIEKYSRNKCLNSRIQIGVALHSPYTCNPELIQQYVALAKKHNVNLQIHLAETKEENNIVKERYGKTPTEYLADLGVFEVPVVLAHGIYLSKKDISMLDNIKGGISHNPISNSKLASGICDVVELRKHGIAVGIGTDAQGSTGTLDMFEEMKVAAYLQKLKYGDPTAIRAYDILKMATIEGAKVMGLDHQIGSIELGKKADIILINLQKAHLQPMNDIYSTIVYAANGADVETVLVDGEVLIEEKKFIKVKPEKFVENTRKIAKRIL